MPDLPLSFLHRPADPSVAGPWLLVLMHGVGSNEQDLFGLAPYVPEQFHVISLRAPYAMGPSAYGWFAFTVDAQGERTINEPQEAASRKVVAETLAAAAQQLGIPPERVVAGGFSQGGIMSLSLLLTQPKLMHTAMVMHSRKRPANPPLTHRRSRWRRDQMLARAGAQRCGSNSPIRLFGCVGSRVSTSFR